MARRTVLTERQRIALFGLPEEESTHLQVYVFSDDDLALIRRRKSAANQIGFALQLCAFRFPGRLLQPGEIIAEQLLDFVAAQLGLEADSVAGYAVTGTTRYRHSTELQRQHGYRRFHSTPASEIEPWLGERAEAAETNVELTAALLSELRRRKIIVPGPSTVERVCADALVKAERCIADRISSRLDETTRSRLEGLLTEFIDERVSRFVWLRRFETGNNSADMNRLLDRLDVLRALEVPDAALEGVPRHRADRLRQEGERFFVDGLRKQPDNRRLSIMAVSVVEWRRAIADAVIETHERIVGRLYRDSERRRDEIVHDERRAVVETLKGFARLGNALLGVHRSNGIAFGPAIERSPTWEGLERLVANAQRLSSRVEIDPIAFVSDGYNRFRRYAPRLIASFEFKGAPSAEPILNANDILRTMNAAGTQELPQELPLSFVRRKWRKYVCPRGRIDRRFWEICVLFELRNALRSGDVWIEESRRYRSIETGLLPMPAVHESARLAVPLRAAEWLESRRERLRRRFTEVGHLARAGRLAGAEIENGKLKIARVKPAQPKEVDLLIVDLYRRIPRIRITDLLVEVDARVGFSDAFVNLRTGAPPRDRNALLTVLLADGVNLGLRKMAEACETYSFWPLLRVAEWHVRQENYDRALVLLIEAQRMLPLARVWGTGETSSSDGQHFPAGGIGEAMNLVNARRGNTPGLSFYTHVSNQYGPYHAGIIPATAHEAPYVLDGLLRSDAGLRIKEHYTDTGGFTDHVFAVTAILGFRFAPRIRDLADKRLYRFDALDTQNPLASLVAARLDEDMIAGNWPDILRLSASMAAGAVVPSQMLRKLAAYPRQNGLALALREVGRVERTLFILDWLTDLDLQRRAQAGLNKGEAHHALKRALAFNRLGEIRDRTRENQAYRAAGVNLLAAAIIYWNTLQLGAVVADLHATSQHPGLDSLRHVAPLAWEHIMLTGEYRWPNSETQSRLPPMREPML